MGETPPRDVPSHYLSRNMSKDRLNIPLPNLEVVLKGTPGLSQRGLAKFMGTHESNISRLIRGKATMLTRDKIKAIEEYTGRTYEYLADLKSAALSEEEADDVRAMRKAPEELRALLRKNLDPYRNR